MGMARSKKGNVMGIRARIEPADIPPAMAARVMGLSLKDFEAALPDLIRRGFPVADQTTGNYSLEAIHAWRARRYPHLTSATPSDAISAIIQQRLSHGAG